MSIQTPTKRLLTRMIIFFLIAASPAALVSAATVFMLDVLIAQEIKERTLGAVDAADQVLKEQRLRVKRIVERAAALEDLQQLAQAVDLESAVVDAEPLAARLTAQGLDVLEIVALRGPLGGQIISSAHLPYAVGDPAPPFLGAIGDRPAVGLVHALVPGNPPHRVPALIAAVTVASAGRPALAVYGGVRLDGMRLESLARMGNATLTLDSPGLQPLSFGSAQRARATTSIELEALPKGRVNASGAPVKDARPTRLTVGVRTDRLDTARSLFLKLAAVLVGLALLMALLLGLVLSRRVTRPIEELSQAAQRVGGGDLDVQLEPKSNDEVGHLVTVFNDMTHELKESRIRLQRAERIAAWREIARRVAHEIKNPLFPIQMSMETLRKSFQRKHPKLEEIVEESTKTVLEEVRALNRIVTEFSEFARLPAPNLAPLDPVELLGHIHSLYTSPQGDPQKPVEVLFDPLNLPAVPKLNADREQLSRALINLVKNGIEAQPEGGRVLLELRQEPDTVVISVQDQGPGLPEALQGKIFTPYFTTKKEGTGLGLPIVDRIVTEHSGRIEVVTKEGEGTRFDLWLPLPGTDGASLG